jgi:anhydro-N-acetylmuramic acid kinase
MTKETRILGIMSGSSLDGLDLALCRFSGLDNDFEWQLDETFFRPFPPKWTDRLKILSRSSAKTLARTSFELAYFTAETIRDSYPKRSIDYIAFHGHTVFHDPENHFTYQIGNGGALAASSGIPVICDFRSADIGLGGQGAPITALFDRWFFPEMDYLVNLGGIVNITLNQPGRLKAFDAGPCNQLLNHLAGQAGLPFDEDGKLAIKGKLLSELLEELWAVDYFKKKGPKTLDNSELGKLFFPIFDLHNGTIPDKLRTAVELIVLAIRNGLPDWGSEKAPLSRMLVTGGGANNSFLMDRLKAGIPETVVIRPDNEWVDFKEAIMIAFLGYLRLNGRENVLSTVTGARRDSVGGSIYLS